MIIDTHCHYNLSPLAENWKKHWIRAQAKGVKKSIIVGTSVETSEVAIQIANQDQHLFATVGLHPNYWQKLHKPINSSIIDHTLHELENVLLSHKKLLSKKIIAIGETGLDYFRLDKSSQDFSEIKQTQIESFKAHLQIATKHNLPLILHVRDIDLHEQAIENNAYWDTLNLIETHLQTNKLRFIMHCFSGPSEYVKKMVELGCYVGIAGNITYPSSEPLREILKSIPTDRILLETDAPFLPPKKHRGKQCEPWMIAETAAFLEKEVDINLEQILTNTQQLFPQTV